MWAVGIRPSFKKEIGSDLDNEERTLEKLGKTAGGKVGREWARWVMGIKEGTCWHEH